MNLLLELVDFLLKHVPAVRQLQHIPWLGENVLKIGGAMVRFSPSFDRATSMVTIPKGPAKGCQWYAPSPTDALLLTLGSYEPETTSSIQLHCSARMTVFDVGANIGYFTLLMAALVGKEGKVYAFEPNPGIAENLRVSAGANELTTNNSEVVELAVTDREGVSVFQFSPHRASCGALVRKNAAHQGQEHLLKINVKTTSLDKFIEDQGIKRVSFVKMDIEGAEMLALKGMTSVLQLHRPVIIVELSGMEHIKQGVTLLSEFGYQCKELRRWFSKKISTDDLAVNILALPE